MQDKKAEMAFFDEFGEEKHYDVFDQSGYDKLLRVFSEIVRPAPKELLLDVGCGSGAFTYHLRDQGLATVGIDLSFNLVRLATTEISRGPFLVGDAEILPFRENELDIVTFSGVLHHLPDLAPALREARRVLRPGGRMFAYDPNGRNPAMWLYRSHHSPFSSREGVTVNERLLSGEEIMSHLVEAGFCDVGCIGVSGISYNYVKTPLLRKLLGLYNFMDGCLDMVGLGKYWGAFLISHATKPHITGVED